MHFNLSPSIEILERTPNVLIAMLENVSTEWTSNNHGTGTWSVYDVVGHLIHGEKTDWIPRVKIILSDKADKIFEPFDRLAQFKESRGSTLSQLLTEFKALREKNIGILVSEQLTEKDMEQKGIHPEFGEVTLRQLLATWVVHDLNHIAQITRVMAKQYKAEVGPWVKYLGIFHN